MKKNVALVALLALTVAGTAGAAQVLVSSNIATSTTWTADNVYNLAKQIYVLPGATLTIQAGTLVQTTAGSGGSLAVCRAPRSMSTGPRTSRSS